MFLGIKSLNKLSGYTKIFEPKLIGTQNIVDITLEIFEITLI